jgi:hypothetical protein
VEFGTTGGLLIDRSGNDISKFITQVCLAAEQGDLAKIRDLAERGPGLNVLTSCGDPLLSEVLQNIDVAQQHRFDVVRLLLDLGADPNILCTDDGTGSLMTPMLNMDTAMLALLLDRGADPNHGCGFLSTETFYDWAVFDYLYEMGLLEELNSRENIPDEDQWLAYLDGLALALGQRRPDHLILLRHRAAVTACEMAVKLGASPNTPVEWAGGWRVVVVG